jgi:hypothetical protein
MNSFPYKFMMFYVTVYSPRLKYNTLLCRGMSVLYGRRCIFSVATWQPSGPRHKNLQRTRSSSSIHSTIPLIYNNTLYVYTTHKRNWKYDWFTIITCTYVFSFIFIMFPPFWSLRNDANIVVASQRRNCLGNKWSRNYHWFSSYGYPTKLVRFSRRYHTWNENVFSLPRTVI